MTLYKRFNQLNIDFSQIGLQIRDSDTGYFCTPKGAEIIGWAGVDGIHYCFVEGFGEMVFSVNPMNLPGEYVHPLAESFEDFLRLLLACNSLDVMEQAYRRDRAAFDCEVWESGFLDDEQVQARETIQKELSLTPMPEPYDYIKGLQASFDYSKIPFTEEYTVWGPEEDEPEEQEWAVYFDNNSGSGRAGKEIPVQASFVWNGNPCHIPAVYLCGKGLVIDFCMSVEPDHVRAFLDKWQLSSDNRERDEDEQERIRAESPLAFEFGVQAIINGRTLRWTSGGGLHWLPQSCRTAEEQPGRSDAQMVRHYRLDIDKAWVLSRVSLPWATQRKPKFSHVKLHLEARETDIPGPRFTAPEVGESFTFIHPVTGTEHTFTVLEYERGEVGPDFFRDDDMEYPCHYIGMTYEISPDIPRNRMFIQDCDRGDSPRPKHPQPGILSSSFGVLFAAAGGGQCAAVSSLHFAPVEMVEWRMTFREKTLDDVDVEFSLDENAE